MSAPGPLGDEARLLVEAARQWAARTFPEEHVATGSTECCWCPVCRAVAAVRRPETAERVAGAVTAAATVLAGLLDSLAAPDRPRDPDDPGGGGPGPGGSGPGGPGAGPSDGFGPARPGPAADGGPAPSVPVAQDIPLDDD